MRARLAVASAGLVVELREILLRDKPAQFLETSPSATVPCLKLDDRVIDESLDIMVWALKKSDPQGLLDMPAEGWELIEENDGPFKAALDHTKYAVRYPDLDVNAERSRAGEFVAGLEARISEAGWIFGERATLADFAILPFVRQFAFVDRSWFDTQPWPATSDWLDRFIGSPAFSAIMLRYAPWTEGDTPIRFNV